MELKSIIETVSKEKNLKKEVVARAIANALEKTMKRQLPFGRVEAIFDENFEFKVYHFKTVVESEPEMLDDESEVNLPEARKLDPKCQVGDEIGEEVTKELTRVDANLAKGAILEVIREEESKIGFKQFSAMKGKIVSGTVQNTDKNGVLVNLGAVEAFLPKSEQLFRERYRRNDKIDALIKDISINNGKLTITLSRSSGLFVTELLKEEVPEIDMGLIEIIKVVREAGVRTKIVVDSEDSSNNAVALCIGSRGTRIQNVMHRIGGERVDIIQYNDDMTKFLGNLLGNVNVRHVTEDDKQVKGEVLGEDLAKAIGKDGINVRLASRIIGRKVTVA